MIKKTLLKLSQPRWSPWIPLGNYHYVSDYMVLVSKNLKTGMLKFKTLKVQSGDHGRSILPHDLIDVREQWDKITNLKNKTDDTTTRDKTS